MLSDNLQQLLTESGRTKSAMARSLGIARSTLDAYLSGRCPMPSDKIELAATFLGVPVGRLFGEHPAVDLEEKIMNMYEKQYTLVADIQQKLDTLLQKTCNKENE